MSNTILTPQGIPTTDFGAKVSEYSDILMKKSAKETEIAKTELAIRELFNKYEVAVRFAGVSDLVGQEEKLTIYKPVVEEKKDGLVYAAARAEGRAFSEIVSNPPLMRKLEKKFGAELESFFRQVDDAFHMAGDENVKRQEEDTEKTTALKTEYMTLSLQLTNQRIELKQLEKELENVDKYLDFCKKVAALAPQQKGGKDQQKGGGNQNQQKGGGDQDQN